MHRASLGQRIEPSVRSWGASAKRHARLLQQVVNHARQARKDQGQATLLDIQQTRGVLVSKHLLIENGQSRQLFDRCGLRLIDGKQDAFSWPKLLEAFIDETS